MQSFTAWRKNQVSEENFPKIINKNINAGINLDIVLCYREYVNMLGCAKKISP